MNDAKKHLTLFLLFILSFDFAISQSSNETASEICIEAVKLMDQGEIDESLVKLAEARNLDPENLLYVYETALAYSIKEDYPNSIQILDSIKNHPEAWDQVFQVLGNAYDYNGNRKKALEIYQMGIKRFPESGVFHQELGNIEYSKENYNEATLFWENGLKADPIYASNYFKLAKLYAFSSEKLWSMIYGELFMLLEPTSSRSEEISKLLFQTYQDVYNKENNFSSIMDLTSTGFQTLSEKYNKTDIVSTIQMPFEAAYAESALVSTQQVENQIDISTILKIRRSFLDYWFNIEEFDKSYDNKLFEYQKLMLQKGIMETYTRWLLAYGNPDEFQVYYNQNEDKVAEFAKWFEKNQILIDRKDFITRKDYD